MPNKQEKKIAEYSIHVCADGEEILFSELPKEPGWAEPTQNHYMRLLRHSSYVCHVHHIIELELPDGSRVEQTTLPTIKTYDFHNTIICPRPHGKGWKVHNNDSDNFTIFRRPKPTGKRREFGGLGEWLHARKGEE